MTLEEAKDYIREWCPYDKHEKIINALEQQPSEDAVSRESVGNMLNNIKMRGSESWIDYYRKALDGLSQLPSVTPTISDVENNYNIGYNCGYVDAMSDVTESEE